jgi:glucose uptake protein GlcU
MITAAILFAIAAVGGVIMALIRFSGRDYPPAALAVIHGLFAAAGLIALLLVAFGAGVASSMRTALLLFVIAALGGFWLLSYHVKRRALPIPLMVIHALVAVIAFIILIVGILNLA